MSNIEDFPGQDGLSPKEKLRKQFFKRLRARIYTVVFIVVVAAAIVISYFTYERTKVYTGTEVLESVVFDVSSGARVESFAGGIMTYSKDGAQAIDSKGNLLWNRTFDMQNPMAEICGKTVAFADYGGSMIYLQTADGESSEIGTDMPIRKIAVSDNGVVAAVLEDVKVTWIYLYNSNGDTIAYFRTTMEKSGYPVNLDITPSGSIVAVSYYSLDIGDIKSSVAFYNFGDVGQNSIDNYVSGYNYKDSLVPIVKFLSNSASFALSAERLAVYEGSEKPVSVKDAFLDKEVLSVFNNNEYIGIILRNGADKEKYLLQIYSAKGNLLEQKAFDFDYSEVVFSNDQYVLYGNTDIYIGTIDGREKLSMEYELPIKLVIPTSSSTKYIIVTESSVDTVQLK